MSDQIPGLLMDGIESIAYAGYESIYMEIVEKHAEKAKQEFIETMKDKLQKHIEAYRTKVIALPW